MTPLAVSLEPFDPQSNSLRIEPLFGGFVVLCPSQQLWSSRDGQFDKPHFFLGKLDQAVNQYFVHIL